MYTCNMLHVHFMSKQICYHIINIIHCGCKKFNDTLVNHNVRLEFYNIQLLTFVFGRYVVLQTPEK